MIQNLGLFVAQALICNISDIYRIMNSFPVWRTLASYLSVAQKFPNIFPHEFRQSDNDESR